jgi:hypothetical protein
MKSGSAPTILLYAWQPPVKMRPIEERHYIEKLRQHSKYKGVTWHKKHKKWMAQIMCDRKKTHLGYFDCEIEAAKAYNSAALAAWGEFAGLNQLP